MPSVALPRAGVALGGLTAVAVVVAAPLVVGAAVAGGLLDPGAVVSRGAPVAELLTELTAAVTLGALTLAAVVLPRPPAGDDEPSRRPARRAGPPALAADGRAWAAAMRVAAVAAGAWTVAALAHLVLTYALVAGTPLDSPGFGAELGLFVTSISLGRTLLGVVAVAAATTIAALLVRTPVGAMATGLLATVALVLQSQTGHASGEASHELAISTMFLHLAGAAVWIGTLAALALVAHHLGRDLAPAVARFSVVALWCYVAVAVSGLVNGAIRTESWSDLTSPYGQLLVAKVVVAVALGAAGWAHRRAIIPRLAGSDRVPRAFWRLVAVELVLMGAVSGLAVALAGTEPPATSVPNGPTGPLTPAEIVSGHPLPPAPTPELWLTSFRWDLLPALGALAAVVVYLRWVRRLAVRGDRWPVGRSVSLVAGMVLFAWTTSGGPAVYGHVLFSAHMVQHMVLVMIVPIFLVLAAPVTLAARALPARADGSWGPREWLLGLVHSRYATFVAHPVVAAVNFAASMVVFYYTDLFALSLTTYLGHLLMVVHFTLTGYLFLNALIGVDPGPARPSHPLRLLLLFATMAFHAFFGVALVSDEALLAPEWFGLLGRPWGPSALDDQRLGGAIAWGISELPMLAVAIALAFAWTRDDERTARRRDRAADRDGDSELVEYNAMLARLEDRAR